MPLICYNDTRHIGRLDLTMDATTVQASVAVGALILAQITLIGGWVYWLVRDLRSDMRDLRSEVRDLRSEMRRNHQELLVLLTGHTHADGSPAVFHHLPGSTGTSVPGD